MWPMDVNPFPVKSILADDQSMLMMAPSLWEKEHSLAYQVKEDKFRILACRYPTTKAQTAAKGLQRKGPGISLNGFLHNPQGCISDMARNGGTSARPITRIDVISL